ncbi:MAG: hypothetical protein JO263_03540 [Candidatus Eremiobacteraeota bacterium]|nr:hypothetical protein [Candidatus Eremiobacteraeota bacterium]
MAATARLVVLMDAADKGRLTKQARAAGLSTAEYVRRRTIGKDDTDAELVAVLGIVRESTAQANSALDRILNRRKALAREIGRREAAARRKALDEFSDVDFAALAGELHFTSK